MVNKNDSSQRKAFERETSKLWNITKNAKSFPFLLPTLEVNKKSYVYTILYLSNGKQIFGVKSIYIVMNKTCGAWEILRHQSCSLFFSNWRYLVTSYTTFLFSSYFEFPGVLKLSTLQKKPKNNPTSWDKYYRCLGLNLIILKYLYFISIKVHK